MKAAWTVIGVRCCRNESVEPWSDMKQYEPRADGVSNTISTILKDNILLVREATKSGYAEAAAGDSVNFEQPNSKTRRGRVGHGIAQTLNTSPQQCVVMDDMRLRYYTPRECFRLMGFDDEAFDKAEAVNSNRQLYKQAGNSIVVPIVQYITKKLVDCGALN